MGNYERPIKKIEKEYLDTYNTLSNISLDLFFNNLNDLVWIRGIYSDKVNKKGIYQIEVKNKWLETFLEHGGNTKELKFLLNYKLFSIVKDTHGLGITEQVYKNCMSNGLKETAEFKYSDGITASTKKIPWIPWGIEISCPLKCL